MLLKHKVNRLLPHPGCNLGGGGGDTTTVQKADPWGPIQPYLLEGAEAASNLFQQGPTEPYSGPSLATLPSWMSDSILSGIGSSMNNTGDFQSMMLQSLAPALNPQATGFQSVDPSGFNVQPGAINPAQMGFAQVEGSGINSNPAIYNALYGNGMSPYLDSMANDLVSKTQQAWGDTSRGMWENLQESQLPQIEDLFQSAGQLGSSRNALLSGQAIGRTNDALAREYGDMSTNLQGQLSNLYGGVYENAQNRSASLASQLAGLGTQERLSQANLIQQMLGANAGFSQEAGLANLSALMQAQLANQGTGLSASLANQNAGLEASGIDMQKLLTQMQAGQMLPGIANFPMAQSTAQLASYMPMLSEEQSLYDLARQQYYESAASPWNLLSQYSSLINPAANMGSTGSTTQPTYSNPLSGAMGGALGGQLLAQSIAGGAGLALGPVGWGITGLGALLGAFG
jgi:hypothetical protein